MRYLYSLLIWLLPLTVSGQAVDNTSIRQRIEAYKKDERGPYKELRWFCPDGSVIPPRERCPEPGGVQRARHKDEVESLAQTHHIFLGQILSNTDLDAFLDADNGNSRLKQYQLERYLRSVDNGWINRRAQFYRGAFQAEDEENWGQRFFLKVFASDEVVRQQYFLIRQALKDIPHKGDDNTAQLIRSQSKVLSDVYPDFMNLRVKIHGQPEPSDIEKVQDFRKTHQPKLSQDLMAQMDELIRTMEDYYEPVDMGTLVDQLNTFTRDSKLKTDLQHFLNNYPETASERVSYTAEILLQIRKGILQEPTPDARLALADLSVKLEESALKEMAGWKPTYLSDLLSKIRVLGQLAAGTGYMEMWEWEVLSKRIIIPAFGTMTLAEMKDFLDAARKSVEWSVGMVRANYQDVVGLYSGFERLSEGFIDDRIRSSVLLPMGNNVSRLGEFINDESGWSNHVMQMANQSDIRGLNPGYAMGELVVITGSPYNVDVQSDKIYIFERPPGDLKPLAGIATVSEGNLVSHVQLMARNLGIPNAVISDGNLQDLKGFSGRRVFYAVSNEGTVIMKAAEEMTNEEKALFTVKVRGEDKINVPTEQVVLDQPRILNLRDVTAIHSGKLCGPKAANLGQLKQLFLEMVVEGLVLPFSIFYQHMQQEMPGFEGSYWEFLMETYATGNDMGRTGNSEPEIEAFTLQRLEKLRAAIKTIALLPQFEKALDERFLEILDMPMGSVPVFVRSDTNMEDLKDFTGAGLNLTLFNVLSRDKILQGIRDVWASPYAERSYKWRQKYLLNPENVYPSILIIPSVDVDCSGVLITKGVVSGDKRELTVAVSRGAGGAVDGQVAETYVIKPGGEAILQAPSRELAYNSLPAAGGTRKRITSFTSPILNRANIKEVVSLSDRLKKVLPETPGVESGGPYDVEFGFRDNALWLFQVRPFVENKRAISSAYLESITPKIQTTRGISLASPLPK